jgi:UPF0755 protein
MRRIAQILVGLALFFVLAAAACIATLFIITGQDPISAVRDGTVRVMLAQRTGEINTPYGTTGIPIRFLVNPGMTAPDIGQKLVGAQLIGDADLFVSYTIAEGIDGQLEAGTYFLSDTMPMTEIAYRLTDSNSSQLALRILEGWRIEEIADVIDSNPLFGFTGEEFLEVVGPGAALPADLVEFAQIPLGSSLEGFMYPDTYALPPEVTPIGLRDILLDNFYAKITPQMRRDAERQNLTIYEAVILASISEREAVHPVEHPTILSVYRNRLEQGIRLDADPTVQYALSNTRGTWWAQITRADYQGVDSPYNTYRNAGLPPGPISNPGVAAIQAAIYPEDTSYLYFRAACDRSGYHEFALTYEEHLQNGCGG